MKAKHTLNLLTLLLANLYGISQNLAEARVHEWAVYNDLTHNSVNAETQRNKENIKYKQGMQARIHFFRGLDLTYRIRRLRYVIKHINELLLHHDIDCDLDALQGLKKKCYDMVAQFSSFRNFGGYKDLAFNKHAKVEDAILSVRKHIALEEKDFDLDEMIVDYLGQLKSEQAKLTIVRAYIGFTFYDILSLPYQKSFSHFDRAEIKVDRISPHDCHSILGHDFPAPLMGTDLYNFGAFFSRKVRENDYLWGRLHAANRLFDFIISAARPYGLPSGFNEEKLRRKLMLAIVADEENELIHSSDMLQELKAKWS